MLLVGQADPLPFDLCVRVPADLLGLITHVRVTIFTQRLQLVVLSLSRPTAEGVERVWLSDAVVRSVRVCHERQELTIAIEPWCLPLTSFVNDTVQLNTLVFSASGPLPFSSLSPPLVVVSGRALDWRGRDGPRVPALSRLVDAEVARLRACAFSGRSVAVVRSVCMVLDVGTRLVANSRGRLHRGFLVPSPPEDPRVVVADPIGVVASVSIPRRVGGAPIATKKWLRHVASIHRVAVDAVDKACKDAAVSIVLRSLRQRGPPA